MDWFSHCNLVTYLSNDKNKLQNMEQDYKKWGNMSKDPGLGGPLGGLCNILFPNQYNKKYMYQSYLPQSGISNKSIIHIVFITMCMNVAKEPIFIYRWNIYFCYIFAHIFLDHVPHMTQNTCKKLIKFCNLVQLWYVIISMMSFYSLTALKIQHT